MTNTGLFQYPDPKIDYSKTFSELEDCDKLAEIAYNEDMPTPFDKNNLEEVDYGLMDSIWEYHKSQLANFEFQYDSEGNVLLSSVRQKVKTKMFDTLFNIFKTALLNPDFVSFSTFSKIIENSCEITARALEDEWNCSYEIPTLFNKEFDYRRHEQDKVHVSIRNLTEKEFREIGKGEHQRKHELLLANKRFTFKSILTNEWAWWENERVNVDGYVALSSIQDKRFKKNFLAKEYTELTKCGMSNLKLPLFLNQKGLKNVEVMLHPQLALTFI